MGGQVVIVDERAAYIRENGDKLVLKLARFVWQMHVLSALLLVFMLKDTFPATMLWPWAAWMIGLGIAQGLISFRGASAANHGRPVARYAQAFDVSAVLLALGWGWLGFVLVPADNIELQTFVGFIISGGVLAGTGTHNMRYPMLAITLTIIMGAMAARAYVDYDGAQSVTRAGMLVLFLGLMLGLGWVLRGFTRQGFALQWDKMKLAEALEAARAEADNANQAKSRFLAQASHDLRQPIHAMGLLLASVPEESLSGSTGMVMGRLKQSVDVLSKLFTSLLDVTLLDTQQIKPTSERLDLRNLIEQVVSEFTPATIASGCALRFDGPALNVETDPLIARRIVQNLVSNAIRHGEGTDILVKTEEREAGVYLIVRDGGPGIAEDDQARMFEAFQRGGSITDATEGLGLGLAIVQRLSALVGASVSLSSKERDGASFAVGPFSIAHEEAERPILEAASKSTSETPSGRVLVIDDDDATLEATAVLLAGWGWDVVSVAAITEVQLSELPKPDLIISDYDLGRGRTGLSAIEAIRQKFGPIPSLVMTGSSSPETLARIEAEGLLVLLKPVQPVQLRSAMISLVS